MGTSLTGLTPSTTYDALIKVGDNGPLSATAKVLSDGLGNDSPLALSTIAVGIGTTTPTSFGSTFTTLSINNATQGGIVELQSAGNSALRMACSTADSALWEPRAVPTLFATNNTERMRITDAGNVGIGTSNLGGKFQVKVATDANIAFNDVSGVARISCFDDAIAVAKPLIISGETIRFTPGGTEVGRFTTNGLTFNGDTSASNALDDYEEGTWTPATSTTGYNISSGSGTYTKIGRQVTIRGVFLFSTINSGSNSFVVVSGLPFTTSAISYTGVIREDTNTGAIYTCTAYNTELFANSMDGVTTGSQRPFAINENYVISLTYFV